MSAPGAKPQPPVPAARLESQRVDFPGVRERPFDIDLAMRRLRRAVRPYPRAALFELRDEGFSSVFELLVACIISVRTRDETTLPVARRVLRAIRTPVELAAFDPAGLDRMLRPATFHGAKARSLTRLGRELVERFGGQAPVRREELISLPGVGPKCANLVLGVALGEPLISVDIHVHRVTHRWGWVHGRTPEQTLAELELKLPKRYRVELNERLVPFGKHVCTGLMPRCTECPLADMCKRVGVVAWR
jgi:endonuclease-3